MKYDVQGGQEIGNSSRGRSLKLCQYTRIVPERKNLSSGSNDGSRSLRDSILQRGNPYCFLNLGRIFVNFGRSSDLGLWFGLEEVTNTGGETTANFLGFAFRL